jgi:2-polyprenyl-6-methoxyphenol hydroxylase-like FAD-dependent oxidoreductase
MSAADPPEAADGPEQADPTEPTESMDPAGAVVGAGAVGLTLAGRLAQGGMRVIVIERAPRHSAEGSKAICMQRETLEIWSREGIGEQVARRGVQWQTGRTYYRGRELFSVQLPGSTTEHFPPFVNISQSEVEEMLLERCQQLGVDLRWGHELRGLTDEGVAVTLDVATESSTRTLRVRYVVGADGAHSSVRHLLGVDFPGHSHEDLFLICDIRARLAYPHERRFFFDPPWNRGRQVLIHPQPDDTWRVDWQVPPDTDVEAERASGGLDRRIRAVIGSATPYELAWATIYRFHQRLATSFRVGNAFLVGDAAHLYAPFGARGLNSGVADAENLAWKLGMVVRGDAPPALLDTYELERRAAAVENLAVTDATMRFMVPHGPWQRLWRNLTLRGSTRLRFLRRRVNSGRLAEPFSYAGSPIISPTSNNAELPRHGAVAPDAPVTVGAQRTRLREIVPDGAFLLLVVGGDQWRRPLAATPPVAAPCQVVVLVAGEGADHVPPGTRAIGDPSGALRSMYGRSGDRAWLIRPDAHLAGSVALGPDDGLEGALGLIGRASGRELVSA